MFASRGLNGIDGQLSTFLGLCQPDRSNWAILGDPTTLYDLSGPWPLAQMPNDLDMNLVVFNNSGGKIFDRMFGTVRFQNIHNLSFEHWAAMWGLDLRTRHLRRRAFTAKGHKTGACGSSRSGQTKKARNDSGPSTKRPWRDRPPRISWSAWRLGRRPCPGHDLEMSTSPGGRQECRIFLAAKRTSRFPLSPTA